MYNPKNLRASVRSLILDAAGVYNGLQVCYGSDRANSERYIVFDLERLPEMDGRQQMDLELNIVGPASQMDEIELLALSVFERLDGRFTVEGEFAFYLYKSTFNRVDGDAHIARYRVNFDLYLYERSA